MSNKSLIGIAIAIIALTVSAIYISQSQTTQPTNTQSHIAGTGRSFEAKVLALEESELNGWEINGKKEESIAQVTEGDRIFFPIIFKNYTTDASGMGEVYASLSMARPDGTEVWRFDYPNITESISTTTIPDFAIMTSMVDGDDFMPTPDDGYPLGIYKIHAEITDMKAGETVFSDITIEKIAK